MRAIPILLLLALTGQLLSAGADGSGAAAAPRPFEIDPIDADSHWTVAEGAGSSAIVQDASKPERVVLRVDGAPEGVTRVVGPSMPADLPVRVGFLARGSTGAYGYDTNEVRLVDADGGVMARLRLMAPEFVLLDGEDNIVHTFRCACQTASFQLLLEAETVTLYRWDASPPLVIPATSQKPFDHIEVVVEDQWIELDHVTVVPEGSGFVEFFERGKLAGSRAPWRVQGGDAANDAGGVYGTDFAGRLITYVDSLGEPMHLALADERLGVHRHEVNLHFRTDRNGLITQNMPLLYGATADGTHLWSLELTYAKRNVLADQPAENLRMVVLRDAEGNLHEVLPLTPYRLAEWSTLRLVTDPVTGNIEATVDGHTFSLAHTGLAAQGEFGVGPGVDMPRNPHPTGVLYVDGIVAGYR